MEVMVVNLEVLGVAQGKSQTDPLSCLLNTPVVGLAFQQEITSATLIFQTMTPFVKTVDTARLLGIDARETLSAEILQRQNRTIGNLKEA